MKANILSSTRLPFIFGILYAIVALGIFAVKYLSTNPDYIQFATVFSLVYASFFLAGILVNFKREDVSNTKIAVSMRGFGLFLYLLFLGISILLILVTSSTYLTVLVDIGNQEWIVPAYVACFFLSIAGVILLFIERFLKKPSPTVADSKTEIKPNSLESLIAYIQPCKKTRIVVPGENGKLEVLRSFNDLSEVVRKKENVRLLWTKANEFERINSTNTQTPYHTPHSSAVGFVFNSAHHVNGEILVERELHRQDGSFDTQKLPISAIFREIKSFA